MSLRFSPLYSKSKSDISIFFNNIVTFQKQKETWACLVGRCDVFEILEFITVETNGSSRNCEVAESPTGRVYYIKSQVLWTLSFILQLFATTLNLNNKIMSLSHNIGLIYIEIYF